MRPADHGGFGDARMRDQRGFDLHRAEAMAGDVQHVVDAAHDPVVAVGIAVGAVAGDVVAVLELAPVGVEVAIVVAPDGAQHRRARAADDEIAARLRALHGMALFVDDVGIDAGQRLRAGAGLGGGDAGQRRNHDGAGFGLPPGIDDRAALAADHAVIPHPRFGIDRLADGAEQAQRLRDRSSAEWHRRVS